MALPQGEGGGGVRPVAGGGRGRWPPLPRGQAVGPSRAEVAGAGHEAWRPRRRGRTSHSQVPPLKTRAEASDVGQGHRFQKPLPSPQGPRRTHVRARPRSAQARPCPARRDDQCEGSGGLVDFHRWKPQRIWGQPAAVGRQPTAVGVQFGWFLMQNPKAQTVPSESGFEPLRREIHTSNLTPSGGNGAARCERHCASRGVWPGRTGRGYVAEGQTGTQGQTPRAAAAVTKSGPVGGGGGALSLLQLEGRLNTYPTRSTETPLDLARATRAPCNRPPPPPPTCPMWDFLYEISVK